MRTLRTAAVTEAVSLTLLVLNLLTAHARAVTALVGPLHGTAYLVVIGSTLLISGAPNTARWRAAIPGIGGLLALRQLVRLDA